MGWGNAPLSSENVLESLWILRLPWQQQQPFFEIALEENVDSLLKAGGYSKKCTSFTMFFLT